MPVTFRSVMCCELAGDIKRISTEEKSNSYLKLGLARPQIPQNKRFFAYKFVFLFNGGFHKDCCVIDKYCTMSCKSLAE